MVCFGWLAVMNSGSFKGEFNMIRRQMLKSSLGSALLLAGRSVAGEPCFATVASGRGPFYPMETIPNIANLTNIGDGKARGQWLDLRGQILNEHCEPMPDVKVEIWQADPGGNYKHPDQDHKKGLDPHFGYFGRSLSDAHGHYRFITLMPGPYPAQNFIRAPHIHFLIQYLGYQSLATELYFSGDTAFQKEDPVFQRIPENKRDAIIGTSKVQPHTKNGRSVIFNITLRSG